MKNKIIVDAGSSKVEWILLSDDGKVLQRTISDGLNAMLITEEEAQKQFAAVKDILGQEESLNEIHYYGAGCATPAVCGKIQSVLGNVWSAGQINVASDLLGAARSLLGKEKGIACILGTGSNSCLYDGKDIIKNVPSLGYILGDEGSGSALGRRLIADAFKGHLPSSIKETFINRYKITIADILDNVYRGPKPNTYLASLVPFLSEHLWNPYIYSLVLEEFTNFIKRNVAMYPGAHSLPIAFTGSIAYYFEKILSDAAERQGYKVAKITRTPMEGIIAFHS